MKEYPDIMTLEQAAEYLQIHERTLYNKARGGEIPAWKIGNRWRFSKAALDRRAAGHNGGVEEDGQG